MVALTSKLELQGFLWKNFYSLRAHVANPILLTPIQLNIKALKILYYVPHCTKEYVKEKEKTTMFTKYDGELLTIMNNCLFNNTLVY